MSVSSDSLSVSSEVPLHSRSLEEIEQHFQACEALRYGSRGRLRVSINIEQTGQLTASAALEHAAPVSLPTMEGAHHEFTASAPNSLARAKRSSLTSSAITRAPKA